MGIIFLASHFFIYMEYMQEPVRGLVFYFLKSPITRCILMIHYSFLPFDSLAETEVMAVLSILVSQFKITIKGKPKLAAETFELGQKRIRSTRLGLTAWSFVDDGVDTSLT